MSNLKGTLQDASGNYLLPIPSDSCPIEESSTASQAYAVNDLFFYNNTLYKCTVAMVQGDTITPGTNCTATTIGGELSQLNSSLDNIDIRYTTANGAEWSPRGAGTWSPFSGFVKDFFIVYSLTSKGNGPGFCAFPLSDGSLKRYGKSYNDTTYPQVNLNSYSTFAVKSPLVSNILCEDAVIAGQSTYNGKLTLTIAKEGYYMPIAGTYTGSQYTYSGHPIGEPVYLNVGDTIFFGSTGGGMNAGGIILYLGTTEPDIDWN